MVNALIKRQTGLLVLFVYLILPVSLAPAQTPQVSLSGKLPVNAALQTPALLLFFGSYTLQLTKKFLPGSFPCLMPGKDWAMFVDSPAQPGDEPAEKLLSLNLPYPDKHNKTTINYDGFSSHILLASTVSAGQQNPPDHLLVIPASKHHLSPQLKATASKNVDSPDFLPSYIDPNVTAADVLPEAGTGRVSLPSHPCKPLLLELNRPHSTRVAEAERVPFRDGFVWIFLEPEGYVSIYPDPDNPPTSGSILHNTLQAGCPVLARIDSEVISLTSHCEATSILTDTGKPYSIPENSMVTLKQNTDGTWVVNIHLPDGTIQSLSVDDYKRLKSLGWELMIEEFLGEAPDFVHAPHRNYYKIPVKNRIKIPLQPIKAKGDKLDGQEAAEGNIYPGDKTPARRLPGELSAQKQRQQAGKKSRSSGGGHTNQPGSSSSGLSKDRVSDVAFWASDFLKQTATRTNNAQNIKVVEQFARDNDLTAALERAAKEVLQSTAPDLLKNGEDLKSLLTSVLSVSGWAELLTKAELVSNEDSLEKLRSQKREVMRKTTRKKMTWKLPEQIQSGWDNEAPASVKNLEKTIAAEIESHAQSVESTVESSPPETFSSYESTELIFHSTPMNSEVPGRKYIVLDSKASLNRIKAACQGQQCDPEGVNDHAINESLQFLHFDQPAASAFIRRLVEYLRDIQALITTELSSTVEQAGILEQEHLMGWFSEDDERLGITLTPLVEFHQLRITRFNDYRTIIEVDIRVPSAIRAIRFNLPETIHIPTEATVELPIKGRLRIAISTENDQPSVYGGSLTLDGLELTDETIRQQRRELLNHWHNAKNQLPDANLQMNIQLLENFEPIQINRSTSIADANAIVNSTAQTLSKIHELEKHQHEFSSALIRKLMEATDEKVLDQWYRIKTFIKQEIEHKSQNQDQSSSYRNLHPYYQAVPDAALGILKSPGPDVQNNQQIAEAVLKIIQSRQTLREKTREIRVSDGAVAQIKAQPEFFLREDEQERLMLILSYGALAERFALSWLDKQFRSLTSQYPALREFEQIGTNHQPESPADLETLIKEALEKSQNPKEESEEKGS